MRPSPRSSGFGAGVRLGRARLELVTDEGLVADDPGVVPRLDRVGRAGSDLELGAVVVTNRESPRVSDADVPELAALRPDTGLMHSDHRQPGWKVKRAAVVSPT